MLSQEQKKYVAENYKTSTMAKMAKDISVGYWEIKEELKRNKWKPFKGDNSISDDQKQIIIANSGGTIKSMCISVYGQKYNKHEFKRIHNYCTRYGIEFQREKAERISKGKNMFLPAVIPDEPKKVNHWPAVYSNPNWQTMYL